MKKLSFPMAKIPKKKKTNISVPKLPTFAFFLLTEMHYTLKTNKQANLKKKKKSGYVLPEMTQ